MKTAENRRVALYLRVSTANGQTVENQEIELRAVAARHNWQIATVFKDQASGAKGREKRPGLDSLLKAVSRREIDMVAAWSVDRLGRSLPDLLSVLNELHAKGVDLYLHQQAIDTSTPSGRALFQIMGVFAEFERAMIRERVLAGLARAKANGKRLGRPAVIGAETIAAIRADRTAGAALRTIAKNHSVSLGTVARITAT